MFTGELVEFCFRVFEVKADTLTYFSLLFVLKNIAKIAATITLASPKSRPNFVTLTLSVQFRNNRLCGSSQK